MGRYLHKTFASVRCCWLKTEYHVVRILRVCPTMFFIFFAETWRRPHPRWVVVWLIAFVLGVTGWPNYRQKIGPNGKQFTEPFPCMHSHCGCRNAAQCWKSCCCKTMLQKLAWAKKQGVAAPAFVVAAAEREATVTTCCSLPKKPVVKACCQTKSACCETKKPSPATTATIEWSLVISIDAQKCQGLPQHWLQSGMVLPLVFANFEVEFPAAGILLPVRLSGESFCTLPETPPPRQV